MKATLAEFAWNALFFAGSAAAVHGIWGWSHPGAWLAGGIEAAVVGFLGGIDQARGWHMDEEV